MARHAPSAVHAPQSLWVEETEKGSVLRWDTTPRTIAISARVVNAETGAPIANVLVSDGEVVQPTDRSGEAPFLVTIGNTDLRFVHVSTPAEYTPGSPWFRMVPPDEGVTSYVFTFPLKPQNGPHSDPFCFLVTGDSQGSGDQWREELGASYGEISRMRGDPQFHAIVGDLVMHGWVEEWEDYVTARRRMSLRHFELFGGHGGTYPRNIDPPRAQWGRTDHFHFYAGPCYYSWNAGPFHCVAVNTSADFYDTPSARERQRRWLKADLAATPADKPLVVFSHYMLGDGLDGLDMPADRIAANFYGHFHSNGVTRVGDVWRVRTAPLRGRDWGRLSAAVRICRATETGIADELRPLGERRRLEAPWPSGEIAGSATSVIVLAFDTAAPVERVECALQGPDGDKRIVGLAPSSQWTWRGDADFSSADVGEWSMRVTASDGRGGTWAKQSAFRVAEHAPPSPRSGRDWPSFLNRSSRGQRHTPDSPQPPFRLAWCAQTGARNVFFSSPVVHGGRAYQGLQDGRIGWPEGGVACFAGTTGREIWRTRLASVEHTPAVRNGKVYVVTCQAEVCCLSADDGSLVWRTPFQGHCLNARTPVVFLDDHVLAGAHGHGVWLLDGDTGQKIVRLDMATHMAAAATGADGRVFGLERGRPMACDAATGRRLWTTDEPGVRYSAAPAASKDTVLYFAGGVYAFDAATGEKSWSCDAVASSRAPAAPAIVDGTAYITGPLRCVALDLDTRDILWAHEWRVPRDLAERSQRPDPYVCFSSPAATNDLVVFGDDTGVVRALRRADGAEVWTWRIGVPLKSSPTVSGNMLFLSDYDGNLYALVGA